MSFQSGSTPQKKWPLGPGGKGRRALARFTERLRHGDDSIDM